jgi:hypothetical protein
MCGMFDDHEWWKIYRTRNEGKQNEKWRIFDNILQYFINLLTHTT